MEIPTFPHDKENIGMVSLVLGEFSNLIDKPQCSLKIRKRKLPFEMVVIHNFPVPDLSFQRPDLRRLSAAVLHLGTECTIFLQVLTWQFWQPMAATSGF